MTLLDVQGLVKRYGERTVVDHISYHVDPGEIVGLLGPNGAGKTTTFRMTVGMVVPDAGEVSIDGEDVTRLPMYKRARLGMGYLSQEPSIFRNMTVTENLLAVLEARGMSRKARRERTDELIEDMGLEHVAGSRSVTLSGGERRRLELARTLALEPRLILLDEPFSGVDPIAVEDIQGLLLQLRDQGMAVLITDHAVRETLGTVDRAYIIVEGAIFREGDAESLSQDPQVRAVYLGTGFTLAGTPQEAAAAARRDAADAETAAQADADGTDHKSRPAPPVDGQGADDTPDSHQEDATT